MGRVNRAVACLWVAVFCAGPARALEIEHTPASCAVEGRHPQIEARLPGAGTAASAHVFFHRTGEREWYAVPLRRHGPHWTASLPAPRAGLRFGYFLSAREGAQETRVPAASAYVVDVLPACSEASLPLSEEGPAELQVPPGAARVPVGFARTGIGRYVESSADFAMPRLGGGPIPAVALPAGTRVRIRLTGLDADRGRVEGTVASWDAEGPLLTLRGNKTRRLTNEEIASLEVRHSAPPALAAVGGLAGAAAGFVGALLVCVSAEDFCGSAVPFWIGTGLGMAAGVAAGSTPSWKRVPLAQRGALALEMESPRKGATAMGLSVRF